MFTSTWQTTVITSSENTVWLTTKRYLLETHGRSALCNLQKRHVYRITLYEDSSQPFSLIDLKPICGYDKRVLQHHPHQLEPYIKIEVFTNAHDSLQEVKQLQVEHDSENVILGIGVGKLWIQPEQQQLKDVTIHKQ